MDKEREQKLKDEYENAILKAEAILRRVGREEDAKVIERTSDEIETDWITKKEEEGIEEEEGQEEQEEQKQKERVIDMFEEIYVILKDAGMTGEAEKIATLEANIECDWKTALEERKFLEGTILEGTIKRGPQD